MTPLFNPLYGPRRVRRSKITPAPTTDTPDGEPVQIIRIFAAGDEYKAWITGPGRSPVLVGPLPRKHLSTNIAWHLDNDL